MRRPASALRDLYARGRAFGWGLGPHLEAECDDEERRIRSRYTSEGLRGVDMIGSAGARNERALSRVGVGVRSLVMDRSGPRMLAGLVVVLAMRPSVIVIVMKRDAVAVVVVGVPCRSTGEQAAIVVVGAVVVVMVRVETAAMIVIWGDRAVRAAMLVSGEAEQILDVGVRRLAVRVVVDAQPCTRRQRDRRERGKRQGRDVPHA